MISVFIQIVVVVVESLLLYAAYSLGKNNPTMISGFKWGVSAEEIAADKRWLKRYNRCMLWNVWITFIAGISASLMASVIPYLAALIAPTLLVVVYLSIKMPRGGRRI